MTYPLDSSLKLAADVEADARTIGTSWPGYAPILDMCDELRLRCKKLVDSRGLSPATIAFVGPKNAGKTRCLSLLVRSDERRSQLPIGNAYEKSTLLPTWLAATRPENLRPGVEDYIPCAAGDLEPLGTPYALLDVPGLDEVLSARSIAARDALDEARLKVLVIDHAALPTAAWAEYLGNTDGATILPVITKAENLEESDLRNFEGELRKRLPHSRSVLAPIVIPHFGMEGQRSKEDILDDARREIVASLSEVVGEARVESSIEEELNARKLRFCNKVAELAGEHLPATNQALLQILTELKNLPLSAAEALLGEDKRLLDARVRGGLRGVLLDRTPVFFFPWRLALSLVNLVHGATDRLMLALLGSLPSWFTLGAATVKNLKDSKDFREEATAGLRLRVERLIKDGISKDLRNLERNLAADLGDGGRPETNSAAKCTVELQGLEAIQSGSTAIFRSVVDKQALSSPVAWLLAIIGTAIFWAIFGQPIVGLYIDFYAAAVKVLSRESTSLDAFPGGTFSILATSAFLAILPMALWLLGATAWATRGRVTENCREALEQQHRDMINSLQRDGLVQIVLSEPRIDACRRLLAKGVIS